MREGTGRSPAVGSAMAASLAWRMRDSRDDPANAVTTDASADAVASNGERGGCPPSDADAAFATSARVADGSVSPQMWSRPSVQLPCTTSIAGRPCAYSWNT